MAKKRRPVPKLCHHKGRDLGYATDPVSGREVYFGPWGLADTVQKYAAWAAQLEGRRAEVASGTPPGAPCTVARLVLDYLAWAATYYTKRGKQTSEVACLRSALGPVSELFGNEQAATFGPSKLKAVRQAYLTRPIAYEARHKITQPDGSIRVEVERRVRCVGVSRGTANKLTQRVRRMFRWAVEQELVPAAVLLALEAVRDLPAGRTAARETVPVAPVPEGDLAATLLALPPKFATLVRLQVLLACRPDELLSMRPCDLDRTALPWVYRPQAHKTEHLGRPRLICVGPQARELLQPLLDQGGPDDRPLFTSKGRGKSRRYRGRLTVAGYRLAVAAACKRAGVPHWTPARLRHNGLTLVRRAAGLEAAQAVGGHAELETTQIYAERLDALARDTVERIG